MSPHRTPTRSAGVNLATSTSAVVALVAVAALMTSLPGAGVRATMLESRMTRTEAPSVRAVAAAVAAAARELVGTERITTALPAAQFADALAAPELAIRFNGFEPGNVIQSRPLSERLLDLPPPGC